MVDEQFRHAVALRLLIAAGLNAAAVKTEDLRFRKAEQNGRMRCDDKLRPLARKLLQAQQKHKLAAR